MTDKVQKIREEVERLKSHLMYGACSSQVAMETCCKEEAYNEVLAMLDTIQEETVNEDLEEAASSFARKDSKEISNPANFYYTVADKARIFKTGAKWQKEQMIAKAVIMEAHEEYGELWGDIRRCNTEKGKRYKVIIIKED